MNIAILGPAGSGKGTMGKRVAEKGQLAIFNTGEVLRKWAEIHDLKLAQHLASGGMAETPLVVRLLREGLEHPPEGAKGWIIDGTPRNTEQALEILRQKNDHGFSLDAVIVLECSEEVCRQRLAARLNCDKCGASYNLNSAEMAPPAAGRCHERCGGTLSVRGDDQKDGIDKRLKLYRERTLPALPIIAEGGIPVMKVNGEGDAQTVEKGFEKALAVALGAKAPQWLKKRGFNKIR